MYADHRNKTKEHEKEIEDYINAPTPVGDYRILKKCLTKEVFEKLKHRQTSNGAGLWDCLCSGVLLPDSKMGIYGCDRESYAVFRELMIPMIHSYFNTTERHPPVYFGDMTDPVIRESLDIAKADSKINPMIKSTRIRVARNLEGFPYAAYMTNEQRNEIESKISTELEKIDDPMIKGKYVSMKTLSEEEREQLVKNHVLFHNRDSYIQKANMYGDWPKGRGAFYSENKEKKFLVWINEEDHMRIISMQSGNDLVEVYERLVKALDVVGKACPFAYDDEIGALNSCPTNVGTGLRASVHIKIPLLAAQPWFKQLCNDLGADIRGIDGEHSESADGTFDISNKRRFGKNEYECLCDMARAVRTVAMMERALAGEFVGGQKEQ